MQAITAVRLLAAPRPVAARAAGLPQAAGDQLAARVRPLGAGAARDASSKAARTRRQWLWRTVERPGDDRQLRIGRPRRASVCDADQSLRPGDPRRIAADQEPRERHQRGGAVDSAQPQLGPHRHADRKQRRRPGRHLRVCRAGSRRVRDEAARRRPRGQRLRAAPHEGPGAHRPAAQAVPRRRRRAHARAGARPTSWPRTKASCGCAR